MGKPSGPSDCTKQNRTYACPQYQTVITNKPCTPGLCVCVCVCVSVCVCVCKCVRLAPKETKRRPLESVKIISKTY